MKKIDAVIIDTYSQNGLARLAIEKTISTGLVNRIHTFSTAPIYEGEEFHRINPIDSIADYNHFLLNIVPYFMTSDATLVIQWDGMPGLAANWNDNFWDYDYIGAPWGDCDESVAVGNGGFSLRSSKLMDTLKNLKIKCDPTLPHGEAEDTIICKQYRNEIEASGCRFAPYSLAKTFSVENTPYCETFGFHGVFNLPLFCYENELMGNCEELYSRTKSDFFICNFLLACLRVKYFDLYSEAIAVLKIIDRFSRIQTIVNKFNRQLPGFDLQP
jgi:hypothetical protein